MRPGFSLLVAIGLLTALALRAAPLPVGPGRLEMPHETDALTLFTYKPPTYTDGPLLVVFHGVQRNAEEYRTFAITLAERFKAIVVAPLFDTARFPSARYQRGGLLSTEGAVQPQEAWTYAFVPRIVAFVRGQEQRPQLPYYLIGHSAGGQFLVRLAAFLPGEAERIIATNPGSHLFPTRDQEFGYGFGGLPAELSSDAVLQRYLAAPLTLYLGTDDIYPRPSFDASPAGMKQGEHRLERGRACFAYAQRLAREKGWVFNWRKVETPGIGHNAAQMFAAAEAEEAIFGRR